MKNSVYSSIQSYICEATQHVTVKNFISFQCRKVNMVLSFLPCPSVLLYLLVVGGEEANDSTVLDVSIVGT